LPPVYPELAAVMGAAVPNLQGLFLRGAGDQVHSQLNGSRVGVTPTWHQAAPLGQIQGDATRNSTGSINIIHAHFRGGTGTGVFSNAGTGGSWNSGGITYNGATDAVEFNLSNLVPTADEIRPANVAVRFLIKAAK